MQNTQEQTTNISSICTMATSPIYSELVLWLKSLNLFHPDIPVYLLTQTSIIEKLKREKGLPSNITSSAGLDEFPAVHWKLLDLQQGRKFLSQKSVAMELALANHSNTLFSDCDMIFTAPLGTVDAHKDIGLSKRPRYIAQAHPSLGMHNSGWVFTRNQDFPNLWRQKTLENPNPLLSDQAPLDVAISNFSVFHFDERYNFRHIYFTLAPSLLNPWARHFLSDLAQVKSSPEDGITYKNKSVVSIHLHLLNPIEFPQMKLINPLGFFTQLQAGIYRLQQRLFVYHHLNRHLPELAEYIYKENKLAIDRNADTKDIDLLLSATVASADSRTRWTPLNIPILKAKIELSPDRDYFTTYQKIKISTQKLFKILIIMLVAIPYRIVYALYTLRTFAAIREEKLGRIHTIRYLLKAIFWNIYQLKFALVLLRQSRNSQSKQS